MTVAQPEDTGTPALSTTLLDALGDKNWRTRQFAVDRLVKDNSPLLIPKLVEIVRGDHRNLSRLNAALQVLTRTDCDVVPALLPLLAQPDADARAYAALALGERGDVRAIEALVAALADADANVRVQAIEALGKLQAAAAVDALMRFVEQLDFELAFPALDTLMAIRDERIAHRLHRLLNESLLKTAAVEALGALGDEEAIARLLMLFEESDVASGTVALAVRRIHDRQNDRFGNGRAIAEIVRAGATPALVSALRSSIPACTTVERDSVISVLGWLEGGEADTALLDLLDNADSRQVCLDALAKRGAGVVPAVLDRFGGASKELQLSLMELLGRLGDRRSVPLLLKCLQYEDDDAVVKSLDALARIGDERTYVAAKSMLGDSSLRIRQAAVNALNSLGDPRTAADMRQLLHNPNAVVCESAIKVAAYFGFPDCVDSVLNCCDHNDDRVQRTAIEHLPCLDDPRIASRLVKALESDSAALRAAAAGALGEVEGSVAVPGLGKALEDPDVWVRYFAVRSLARYDYPAEISEKLASLAASDPAMQVRIAALESLKSEALPTLAQFAVGDEVDLAIAALKALGAMRNPVALPVLLQTARASHDQTRIAAIRALGQSRLAGGVESLREIALGRVQLFAEEAIGALGLIPQEESVVALLAAMTVPSKRAAAGAALAQLREISVAVLACRLQQLPLDVRRAVVGLLARIGSREANELLEIALADKDPAVRFSAIAALAHVRHSDCQIPNDGKGDA